jgi:hypothetical protein
MNYASFVTYVSTMMGEQDPGNPDFVAILPNMIDYAEGRCYRDLDMIGARITDTSALTSPNTREMPIPETIVVVEGINIIDTTGVRVQLVPTSREFLNFSYPNSTGSGMPRYFGMVDNQKIILGPWPDAAYQFEISGVGTPQPLSANNTQTLLTSYVPDLFLAAAMIYASAYQKNFGAQSDDPQTAQSWEAQYQALIQSAKIWETRKKFYSEAWSSKGPNPIATPPRV